MMFKVGDIVKAIDNKYRLTNKRNNFVGKVVVVNKFTMVVETISCDDSGAFRSHNDNPKEWNVDQRYFELVERGKLTELKERLMGVKNE